MTWLRFNELGSFDPAVMINNGTSDALPGYALFDALVYTQNGQVIGHTADSVASADGVNWTLKLHPGIRFSDSTPYDANAVIFNIRRLQDPANAAPKKPQADQIATMDAPDSLTVKFGLKNRNGLFPQILALLPGVGSPTAIQSKGKDGFASSPVGAGPFVLKSWVRDSQMVLERNPTYWDAPRPYIDRLIIKPIIDEPTRLNSFCSGQGDLASVSAPATADTATQNKCGNVLPMTLNGGVTLLFNTTKPPMSNLKLRQAMALAFDDKEYSTIVDNGIIPPSRSIFRPDSPFFDPSVQLPPADANQAQTLINQAASELGVTTININFSTFQTNSYQAVAQYFAAKLNGFKNIKTDITVQTSTQHNPACTQLGYPAVCVYAVFFDDPDPALTGDFTCSTTPKYTGYCNPKFDSLVLDNEQTLDPNQRVADVKDMQRLLYADVPALFVEPRYSWTLKASNVQSMTMVNDGLALVDRMWLKTR